MTARVLFDLDHAAEVREELYGPAQVVEVVHGPRRVLGHELDIVELTGLTHELGDGGPRRHQVRTEARQTLVEELT